MHIEIGAGYASRYFVTDARRGVAVLREPALLVSPGPVDLHLAAAFLGFLMAGEHPGFRDHAGVVAMLNAFATGELKGVKMLGVERPVVILAESFAGKALLALKILKLRGQCPLLAIALPGGGEALASAAAQLAGGGWGAAGVFSAAGSPAAGRARLEGLTVVSGADRTVVSTEQSAEQVLETHPGLCSGPVESIDEPLT